MVVVALRIGMTPVENRTPKTEMRLSNRPPAHSKTARENPAPLANIKMSECDQPLRINGCGGGGGVLSSQRKPSFTSFDLMLLYENGAWVVLVT
jgi:hypothetical protein